MIIGTFTKLEVTSTASNRIILEGGLSSIERFAYVNGLTLGEEHHRIIEINGPITITDTTKITGWWVEDVDGNEVGMVKAVRPINEDRWAIQVKQNAIDLTADEMTALLNNNLDLIS